MRWLGRAAVTRAASPTPRPSSARTALGVRLMSAPTRANCFACSNTVTSWPARFSAMAATRPPMPAPTMPMVESLVFMALSLLGNDVAGLDDPGPHGRLLADVAGELGG